MKKMLPFIFLPIVFLACRSEPKPSSKSEKKTAKDTTASVNKAVKAFHFEGCYQLEEINGDTVIVTFISIEIEGNEVFGEEAIEITSPEHSTSAVGSLEGVVAGGVLRVRYDYTVDGAGQSEEQEFYLQDSSLLVSSGPLNKVVGKLGLSPKGLFDKTLPKVDCN